MADYQEYRRRVLHRRWRRRFMAAGCWCCWCCWAPSACCGSACTGNAGSRPGQNTILQEVTQDNTWNTVNYALARQLTVQTLYRHRTALDFRMAALPQRPGGKKLVSQVSFVGDSLTQGMQMYDTGLPGAMFCAYKGVGPNAIVNGTSCKRADGVAESAAGRFDRPAAQGRLCAAGHQRAGPDTDYTSFLTYYRLMLDMISQALPDTQRSMCSPSRRCGRRWLHKGPRGPEPRPPVPHQQ